MDRNTAKYKSERLALRIIRLYKYLCNNCKEYDLFKQLLRSGTSIGANLSEAECAISKNDFLAKVYIDFKECAETQYWLRLLNSAGYTLTDNFKVFMPTAKNCAVC